jgi:uncharacterized membrane protein
VGKLIQSTVSTLIAGLVVVIPVYLATLLLLKAMQSLGALVKPVARLIPDWLPAEGLLSVLLVLVVCLAVGVLMRTWLGHTLRAWLESELLNKLPGYTLFKSLTQRLAGRSEEVTWKPALAEIEEALVPAFIIEELSDGRYTVFVPSVPTPFAGAVYVLTRERVHPVNISFPQAIKAVSRWGAGCGAFVAAMEDGPPAAASVVGGPCARRDER